MWHKVEFAPHPCFHVFFNVFIGFIEYSIGCGTMSTLCHTCKASNHKGYMGIRKGEKHHARRNANEYLKIA